jgi:hypothetical protein
VELFNHGEESIPPSLNLSLGSPLAPDLGAGVHHAKPLIFLGLNFKWLKMAWANWSLLASLQARPLSRLNVLERFQQSMDDFTVDGAHTSLRLILETSAQGLINAQIELYSSAFHVRGFSCASSWPLSAALGPQIKPKAFPLAFTFCKMMET